MPEPPEKPPPGPDSQGDDSAPQSGVHEEPSSIEQAPAQSDVLEDDDFAIDIDFDDDELFAEPDETQAEIEQTDARLDTQEIEAIEDLDEYEAIEIATDDVVVNRPPAQPTQSTAPPPPIPVDQAHDAEVSGPGLDAAFDETLPPVVPSIDDPHEGPLLGGSAAKPPESGQAAGKERGDRLEIPGVELLGVGATTPKMPALATRPGTADDAVQAPSQLGPDVVTGVEDTLPHEPAFRVEALGRGVDSAAEPPSEREHVPVEEVVADGAEAGEERPTRGTTAPYGSVSHALTKEPAFDPSLLAPPGSMLLDAAFDATGQTEVALRPLSFGPLREQVAGQDVDDQTGGHPDGDADRDGAGSELAAREYTPDEVPTPLASEDAGDAAPLPARPPDQGGAHPEPPFEPESISGLPLPLIFGDSEVPDLTPSDPASDTNVGFQVLADDESEAPLPPSPPELPSFDAGLPPAQTEVGQRAAEASLQAKLVPDAEQEADAEQEPPTSERADPGRPAVAESLEPPELLGLGLDTRPSEPKPDDGGRSFDFDTDHEPGGREISLTAELDAAVADALVDSMTDLPAYEADLDMDIEIDLETPEPPSPRTAAGPSSPSLFDGEAPEAPRPGPPTSPPTLPPPRRIQSEPEVKPPPPPRVATPPPETPPPLELEQSPPVPPREPAGGAVATPLRALPPEADDLEDFEPLADVRFVTDGEEMEDPITKAEVDDSGALELLPIGASDDELIGEIDNEDFLEELQELETYGAPTVGLDSNDLPGIPNNPFQREGTPVISGGALPLEPANEARLPELEPLRPLSEQAEAVEALSGEHLAVSDELVVPGALPITPSLEEYLSGLLEARPGPGGVGACEAAAADVELGTPDDVVLTARLSEYGGPGPEPVRIVTPSAPLARAIVDGLLQWPERPTMMLGLIGSGKSHALNRLASALAANLLEEIAAGNAFEDELEPLLEEGPTPIPVRLDLAWMATRAFSDGEALLNALIEANLLPEDLRAWRGPAVVLADNVNVGMALAKRGFDPLYLLRTLLNSRPQWRAVMATRPLDDAVFLNWGSLHGPFPVVEVAGMRAPQTRNLLTYWSAVAEPSPSEPAALARLLPGEVSASPRLVEMLLGQWPSAANELEAAAIRGGGSSIARLILDGVCGQTEARLGTRNTRQDLQILADTLGGLGSSHLLLDDVQALLDEGYLRDDLDTLRSTGIVAVHIARGGHLVGGLSFTHPLFQEVLLAEYLEQEIIQLAMRRELDVLVNELQPAVELAPYPYSQVRRLIEVADLLVGELASHLRPDLTESIGTWLWQQLNADVYTDNPHYPRLVSVAWIIAHRTNAVDNSHDGAIRTLKEQCSPMLQQLLSEAQEYALSEAIDAL